jgi:hypothetical protein
LRIFTRSTMDAMLLRGGRDPRHLDHIRIFAERVEQ